MTNSPSGRYAQDPFPVSGPVDILAFIPHSLGFVPHESLVLMTMDSSRLGATLRLDLPDPAVDYSDFAVRVTELLRSDGSANGVLMAMYTHRKWKKPGFPPHRRLIDQLGRHLSEAGLPLRDGWLVSDSTWREYFCTDSDCCPWPGHSLGQITDSTLSAEMVFQGSAYARSLEEAVGCDLPREWANAEEAARHRTLYTRRLTGRWCRRSQFAGTLAFWEALWNGAAPEEPGGSERPPAGKGCPQLRTDPEAAGFLLASLHARPVRDTLLVMAALGSGAALDGAEACGLLSDQEGAPLLPPNSGQAHAWLAPDGGSPDHGPETAADPGRRAVPAAVPGTASEPGPRTVPTPGPGRGGGLRRNAPSDPGQDFRDVLVGAYAGVPDWAGMDAAFAVFSELLAAASGGGTDGAHVDREAAAALLSLLAWIEWARGRGSRARVYLSRCLEGYPGYRLAELLDELLATGMFPVWARNAETAWRSAPEQYPGTARA
ncbi:DUF4192 domain-containing protein [Arthrobacter sp. Z1-15]